VASAITHFIVGGALALPVLGSHAVRQVLPAWAIPVIAGLAGVAPDFDTWIVRPFDVPRGSLFAHRGFFHSPAFLTAFFSLLAIAVARGHSWRTAALLGAIWSGAAITHPLLDMLTTGGGIMLLYPFSTERLFFPWRPIRVSPLSISRFFSRAGPILLSELPFCAAALAIGLAGLFARRFNPRGDRSTP
jgi:inner membrane protein